MTAGAVVLGTLIITGWREHWLRTESASSASPASSASSAPVHRVPPGPAAAIRFTSDQGVILTRPGAQYQLAAVVADASGRGLPGRAVRWQSDDPAQVSVDSDGVVTAHVAVGSATITATAAGLRPQAAQVLVASPAPGTVVVPTRDIVTMTSGEVTLRRTPQTAAIAAGNILVSNGRSGGGLLARVLSVQAGASSVTAVTSPASLASAFVALSVNAVSAPAVAAAAVRTTAALSTPCMLARGATGSVALQGPGVSVPATLQLSGVLNAQSGVVQRFHLAVKATLPIVIRSGSVTVSAAGGATATCELAVTDIPVPTPIFLGPVEISGEVEQAAGVDVSLNGRASLTISGPVLSDTVTADNGIQYTSAHGWSSVDDDRQSGISVTPGPGPAAHAALSATLSPFLRVGFGVAGTLGGDNLAGTSLAFTRAQGNYNLTTPVPFTYLTPGYAGPRWNTSLGLTGGPEIDLTGNLATLLGWLGLTLPDLKWNLADVTVPLQSSPSVTVTAAPGAGNTTAIRLSTALPAGFSGDKVDFVQYPPQGGKGTVVATATVSGGRATGSWTRADPAPGTRVAALVFDHVYGAVGLPYASSTTSAPAATPAGTWTPVTLPAVPGSAQSYQLNGVSCSTPASCVAAGYYGPQGAVSNLAETLSGGTWTPDGLPPPPLGLADPNPGLDGISCPVTGTCVAAGLYDDQNSNTHGMVETLSGGTWTPAEPPAPANAAPDPAAGLYGVACPAAGSCVAVGGYDDQQGIAQAMIETLANGTWTPAEAPLPGPPPGPGDFAALLSVSCPAPSSCVAVGYYGQEGRFSALIETLSGGTWTPATAPLPAGQADLGAELSGISCPAPGTCVAVGNYSVPGFRQHALAETLSGSTWTAATVPAPAGITDAELSAVSCPAPGACAAAGETGRSAGGPHALLATLSGGTWTPVSAPLPAGASARRESRLSGVSCPATGTCVATGFYTGPDGYHQLGLAETIGTLGQS
jgi:hypothetical protein